MCIIGYKTTKKKQLKELYFQDLFVSMAYLCCKNKKLSKINNISFFLIHRIQMMLKCEYVSTFIAKRILFNLNRCNEKHCLSINKNFMFVYVIKLTL